MTIARSVPTGARSMSGGRFRRRRSRRRRLLRLARSVCATTSITSRAAPRRPAVSVVRNDANRGPRSIAIAAGPSPGLTLATRSGEVVAGSAASSASASKRTISRVPVLRDGVRRRRRDVERQPRQAAERLDAPDDARHADVADEDQPRRLAQLERGHRAPGERARHEVDRHVPRPSFAHRRRGQRDQSAIERRQALARREHDRLRAGGDGQSAGRGVFADDDAEQPRQVVEREHLLAAIVRAASGRRPSRETTV